MDEERMGDMGPSNLEEKFTESFSTPSQVPWRSRSGRGDMWEKVGPVTGRPSHFRPLSVDETQFESLKSQSFRSATSFSSQASSMSNSPTRLSPSDSVPSDSPNSGTEESGKKKDFRASYPPASQSPQTTVNREARLNAFHLRRYSSGSLFQKDLRGTSKDKLKDLSGRKEDSLASKERGQGALKLDRKLATATVAKPTSKGKSVRTIRSGVYTPESIKFGEMIKTHIDDKAGEGSDVAKAVNTGKNEMKREGLDNMSGGINKKNLDTHYDVPMPTYAKYLKKEKEEGLGNVAVESETDLESKTDSTPPSSDEGSVTDFVSDAGGDPNEVDKKAGEFIAKFREQIRLQKVASIEKSKVKRMSGKHLR
ncbi:hypothetical protein GH714_019147 [Hevea brasiliensis]|uniref:Uncharacterized protein n=1 Tax=Hevea brasiliensis TaxID=3981 RepID=A0A6A6LTI8_HEVBR|nr:hypothetical protein GH714_019147 [Hevea brasiliensis]